MELKQIDLADCPHCFGVHDAEIHDATTSVHIWLRQEVARKCARWHLIVPSLS